MIQIETETQALTCFRRYKHVERPMNETLPSFPEEHLPEPMHRLVGEASENIQAPDDMLACNSLGAVSLCAQGYHRINPKPGYSEPVNLYLACIAGPSERKSPAQNLIMRAPRELIARRNAARAEEFDRYRMELLRAEAEASRQESAYASEDSEDSTPPDSLLQAQETLRNLRANPVRPINLFADDVTPERLAELMNENKGRMGLVSTEGGVFDMMRGMYSSRANLDIYTKSYSGDPISIGRKGSSGRAGTNIYLPSPCLTICAMIQPEVLKSVMGDRMLAGKGLLARFLYSMPKSMAGHRVYRTKPIDPQTLEDWENLLGRILDAEGAEPKIITLSGAAAEADEDFYNSIEAELTASLAGIAEWAGKFHGNVLRIAALLHICRNPEAADIFPVSSETMEDAIAIGRYFLAHARAAFDAADSYGTKEEQDARYLWRLLQGHDGETVRTLLRRSKFNRVDGLKPGLLVLADHGYLACEQVPNPGARPSTVIRLNPLAVEDTKKE